MNHEKSIKMLTMLLEKGDDRKAFLVFLAIVDLGRKDLTEKHKIALRALLGSFPSRLFLQFLDAQCKKRGIFSEADQNVAFLELERLAGLGEENSCIELALRHVFDEAGTYHLSLDRDCSQLAIHVKNKAFLAKELEILLQQDLVSSALMSDRPSLSIEASSRKIQSAMRSLVALLQKQKVSVDDLAKSFG